MGQLAPSPASCVSNPPCFPGVSPLLHPAGEVLVLPCPIAPIQAAAVEAGGTGVASAELPCPADHLHERPGNSYVRGLAQLPPGLLGFLVFSPASWINKGKDVGSLCWTPCWLWSSSMQWNSEIFLIDFFFVFKFWCKMTLLSKIVFLGEF